MDIQNEQNEESDTDDEEIYFQKELEIALYSQIHFEPNTDSSTQDFLDLPYDITVEGNDRSGYLSNKSTSDLILNNQLKEKYSDDLLSRTDLQIKKVISDPKRTPKHDGDKIKQRIVVRKTTVEEKQTTKDGSNVLKIAKQKPEKLDSKKSFLAEKLILGLASESDSDVSITISDRDEDDDDVNMRHGKERTGLEDKDMLKETTGDDVNDDRDKRKLSPAEKVIYDLLSESDSEKNITISDDDDDDDALYTKCKKESTRLKDIDEFVEALTDDSDSDSRHNFDLDDHTGKSDIQSNIVGGRLPISSTSEIDDVTDEEDWKILHADAKPVKQNRYFKPVVCFNCKERGHISNVCPKPKKQVICNLCSEVGHTNKDCPETYCSNCLELGHNYRECKMPRYKLDVLCHRCQMEGHHAQKCPDQWRQFHQTVEPGMLVRGKPRKRSPLYCYNCGGDDHLGHECMEERATRYVRLTTPFVCKYQMHKIHKESMVIEVRDDQTELQEKPTKRTKTEYQQFKQKNVRAYAEGRIGHPDSDFVRQHKQFVFQADKPKTELFKRQSSFLPNRQKKFHWKKSNLGISLTENFKGSGRIDALSRISLGTEMNKPGGKRNAKKKNKTKRWKSQEKKTDESNKETLFGGETNDSGRNRNKKRNRVWKVRDKGRSHVTVDHMTRTENIPVTGLVKNPRGFKTKLKYRNQAETVFTERQELNNLQITLGKPFKGTVKPHRNVVMDKSNAMGASNNRNKQGKVKAKQLSKNKKRKRKE